ncbi:MAG: hypothetical protein WAW52_01390 [Methanothrix sp.]
MPPLPNPAHEKLSTLAQLLRASGPTGLLPPGPRQAIQPALTTAPPKLGPQAAATSESRARQRCNS